MMRLEIETGNAAFRDPDGEPNEFYESEELCRILHKVTRQIESGITSGSIHDINGNRVGFWER